MTRNGSVHEPEAELLSAEDAIDDANRLRSWMQKQRSSDSVVYIPLHLLLDAIDHLEPEALRQVVQRAEERLLDAA